MSPSTWQSDLTSHQMMSCQWRRRGKEQRPPAPDRTEREKKDILRQPQIYIYMCVFPYWNSYFTLTGNRWSNLRKAFSPQSHSWRRKKSTFPLSLSFTGQYTTVVSIPSTTKHTFAKELLQGLFVFNFYTERLFTYLLFHSACWVCYGLQDVQQEMFSPHHSCQRGRSYSGLCPQLHVEASLETPTALQSEFYIRV